MRKLRFPKRFLPHKSMETVFSGVNPVDSQLTIFLHLKHESKGSFV